MISPRQASRQYPAEGHRRQRQATGLAAAEQPAHHPPRRCRRNAAGIDLARHPGECAVGLAMPAFPAIDLRGLAAIRDL